MHANIQSDMFDDSTILNKKSYKYHGIFRIEIYAINLFCGNSTRLIEQFLCNSTFVCGLKSDPIYYRIDFRRFIATCIF